MASFKNLLEYMEKWKDPKLLSDLNNFVMDFVDEKGQEIVAKTKLRTPVVTGALRNAWQTSGAKKTGNDYYVQIENNQDYASYVEYGTTGREWKWKNGAFMLTKSLNEVEKKLHNDFDNKFTKFLRDKGIG